MRIGSAAIILDENRRVLFVKQTYGRRNWELPGGHVEPDESMVDVVVREVRKETGLRVVPVRLAGLYYEAEIDLQSFAFHCSIQDGGTPRPGDSEIEARGFFAVDDLPRPTHSFVERRVRDALAGQDRGMPELLPARSWLD